MKSVKKLLEFSQGRPFTLRDAADSGVASYRQLQRNIVSMVEGGLVKEIGVGHRGQKLYVVAEVANG